MITNNGQPIRPDDKYHRAAVVPVKNVLNIGNQRAFANSIMKLLIYDGRLSILAVQKSA